MFRNIVNILQTRSSYFILQLVPLVTSLQSTKLFNSIYIDYDKISLALLDIIILYDQLDVKVYYYTFYIKITSNPQYFETTSTNVILKCLEQLFLYNQIILSKLIDNKENNKINMENKIKAEQQIVCYLQFLSHCALYGHDDTQIVTFLCGKELQNQQIECLQYGKEKSYNILAQIICTLANYYQKKSINNLCLGYSSLFKELIEFKQYLRFNVSFEYILNGLSKIILENNDYKLCQIFGIQEQHNQVQDDTPSNRHIGHIDENILLTASPSRKS